MLARVTDVPLMAVIVILNSVGGWGGFGAAVSRMPYAAGVDHLLPAEERERRKHRLTKGPKEFRNERDDLPNPKA